MAAFLLAVSVPTFVAPVGLLCDYQKSPALGVRPSPFFSWIVPPCAHGTEQQQVAYTLVVWSDGGKQVWSSGRIVSNDSTYVAYAGPALDAGAKYTWAVTTWTNGSGGGCQSDPSVPAALITALSHGWSPAATFISAATSATFSYFRKEVRVPEGVVSAVAFITAPIETPLLANYKLYVDGHLVDVGPGRGEAPVWGGDGFFRSIPYATLDVTAHLAVPGSRVVAIEAMHSKGATAMMQLHLSFGNGSVTTLVTDGTWSAFDGDVHRKPGRPKHGNSAGTGFIEYIDARGEPAGWKGTPFTPGAGWAPATTATPTDAQRQNLHPKMEPPLQVYNVPVRLTPSHPTS